MKSLQSLCGQLEWADRGRVGIFPLHSESLYPLFLTLLFFVQMGIGQRPLINLFAEGLCLDDFVFRER